MWKKITKAGAQAGAKRAGKVADAVLGRLASGNSSDLAARAAALRVRLAGEVPGGDDLVEALELAARAIEAETGLVLRRNQLMAAAVLNDGCIAEMRTGEGKTLAGLAGAFALSLAGHGVHVITANEYLAQRDSELAQEVLGRLGASVGLILGSERDAAAKRAAYASDITYTTANELGFDYLRDRLALELPERVMRHRFAALVDEADAVLLDDATVPLILSGPSQGSVGLAVQAQAVVAKLSEGEHYDVDLAKKTVGLTPEGVEAIDAELGIDLWAVENAQVYAHLNQALLAKELYKLDRDYIIAEGEIRIVDERTGRVAEGRRWSDGLHQAIEVKEGLEVQPESQTLASITLQRFFSQYELLGGMTGTAMSSEEDFAHNYDVAIVEVPSHRPVVRIDHSDIIFPTRDSKLAAVADAIEQAHGTERPVLVGTASVGESEALAEMLAERGIAHAVLNAKAPAREAAIIAQAGRPGAVTISTSMAGRGVDVLLGGDPAGLATDEDELQQWQQSCAADGARVRELGGLLVLGTTRYSAKRIDDQLRGRSGRQGDPGESRFYVSLEDDVLAPYIDSKALNWVVADGPIDGKTVTKAVDRAQKAIEAQIENNRMQLMQYDDVSATQREIVWQMRTDILEWPVEELLALCQPDVAVAAEALDRVGREYGWEATVSEARRLYAAELDETELHDDEDNAELIAEAIYDRLEVKIAEFGEHAPLVAKRIWLGILDVEWVHHLDVLDALREGIHLRQIVGKNPVIEWANDAMALFDEMLEEVSLRRVTWMCQAEFTINEPDDTDSTDSDEQIVA